MAEAVIQIGVVQQGAAGARAGEGAPERDERCRPADEPVGETGPDAGGPGDDRRDRGGRRLRRDEDGGDGEDGDGDGGGGDGEDGGGLSRDGLAREVVLLRSEVLALRERVSLALALSAAGAVDVEAALPLAERLLAEAPMQEGDEDSSGRGSGARAEEAAGARRAPWAAEELRRLRPALFGSAGGGSAGGMAPAAGASGVMGGSALGPGSEREDLAADAGRTGDRRAVLRYMRARRAPGW